MVTDTSLRDFVEALASPDPVPGGGGASAVVGALAVALGEMDANLTVGKERYADVRGRVEDVIVEARGLRADLLDLADRDAEAFMPVSRAYALPRDTPEERAARASALEVALRGACEAPLEVMERVSSVIGIEAELADIGSRLALSDAGVGAELCEAALRSASLNVLVNTRMMSDRERAAALNARAEGLLESGCARARAVYEKVRGELS